MKEKVFKDQLSSFHRMTIQGSLLENISLRIDIY